MNDRNKNRCVKTSLLIALLIGLSVGLPLFAQLQGGVKLNWKNVNVLVYTKNGKGYVHENIPYAVTCIQKMAQQYGFGIDTSDDPAKFKIENLKQYSLLIFASTNNDVFDNDDQRLAFRQYIEAGGGFVGIHSVVGAERKWPWFKAMLGGTFDWHPPFQRYRIVLKDTDHVSVTGLPKVWEKEDECYFMKELSPNIQVLLHHDLTSLNEKEKDKISAKAKPFSGLYPAAWHQQFDGGTIWITALGHDKKDYSDPVFIRHVLQGIGFVASQSGKPDFKKTYAISKDDPIH